MGIVIGGLGTLQSVSALETAPAEIVASPSPAKSPGLAPLLPPAGLPTAPPPDAIKPVEPQAGPDHHDLQPVGTKRAGGV